MVARIRVLRETYPRWGKAKLAVLLRAEGWPLSVSTVGRTLRRLRRLGQLREPAVVRAQRRGRRVRRPYARRKPWAYVPRAPGDLVQLDTMVVEVLPGLRRVHFTARDVISRMDVLAAYARGTSRAAERVLHEAFPRFGFPIRAIQIDGGSEFKAAFEAACAARGIQLFVLQQRLVKTGGRLVKHALYYWLLLAEGHLTRRMFGAIVQRLTVLSVPAG